MEKTQITLSNTQLQNVLAILFDRLKNHKGMSQTKAIEKNDYQDGIKRDVIYHYNLQNPNWQNNKLIVNEHYYISVIPGKTDLTSEEVIHTLTLDGLVFTGWQLQTNTVMLELEYAEHWQDLVNNIMNP